ncbi:MAG TPA: hypothetical protein DCZ95_16510 [Verrucomicrobia bacterium]|nr:MAG: hypothetical protein A2X46_15650 [Lentisphaerae bacterium GWF2_57_35]HBA85685.1 hypothetical protein [Verrucomicrobiota bacterium]
MYKGSVRIQEFIRYAHRSGELERIEESWARGCVVCYIRRRFKAPHPVRVNRHPKELYPKVSTYALCDARYDRRRRKSYTKCVKAWTRTYVELCGKRVFA